MESLANAGIQFRTYNTLAVLALCIAAVSPMVCQAQFKSKQKVILSVPDGHERWLVADTCMEAGSFVVNNAFHQRATRLITERPALTYAPNAAALVEGVDESTDGECVQVSVQLDGPNGWVYGRLAILTPEEKRKATAQQAAAQAIARKQAEQAEAERQAIEKVDPTKSLQLLEYEGSYDKFSTTILGRVRNNTNRAYRYVQITFSLYDESGNQVGTALANINNLDPGGVWKFKATGLTPSKRFKVSGLSGI